MKYKKGLSSRQMSSLYRRLQRKGLSRHRAFQITGNAKRLSKIEGYKGEIAKRKYGYLDFDGDGKVNRYDCQPYNRWKQDKNPTYKKRQILDLYKRKYGRNANLRFGMDLEDDIIDSPDGGKITVSDIRG